MPKVTVDGVELEVPQGATVQLTRSSIHTALSEPFYHLANAPAGPRVTQIDGATERKKEDDE